MLSWGQTPALQHRDLRKVSPMKQGLGTISSHPRVPQADAGSAAIDGAALGTQKDRHPGHGTDLSGAGRGVRDKLTQNPSVSTSHN